MKSGETLKTVVGVLLALVLLAGITALCVGVARGMQPGGTSSSAAGDLSGDPSGDPDSSGSDSSGEEPEDPSGKYLSETLLRKSKDGQYLLCATAFDYAGVQEAGLYVDAVGYLIDEDPVFSDEVYTSITWKDGGTDTVADLFGAERSDWVLIVTEITYREGREYKIQPFYGVKTEDGEAEYLGLGAVTSSTAAEEPAEDPSGVQIVYDETIEDAAERYHSIYEQYMQIEDAAERYARFQADEKAEAYLGKFYQTLYERLRSYAEY